MGGRKHDRLYGRSGADDIAGGPGNDAVYGGKGNDGLTDLLPTDIGGGQAVDRDRLVGGTGKDQIGVSRGPDRVFGGRGDDRIKTFDDNAVDTIRCGPGFDVVIYSGPKDPSDVLSGCERVRSVP
jgi:Ca2+-binding RTX toxin-like protein